MDTVDISFRRAHRDTLTYRVADSGGNARQIRRQRSLFSLPSSGPASLRCSGANAACQDHAGGYRACEPVQSIAKIDRRIQAPVAGKWSEKHVTERNTDQGSAERNLRSSAPETRLVFAVFPGSTNHYHTLFGGTA